MELSSPMVVTPVEDVAVVDLPTRITISRDVVEQSVTIRAHVRQGRQLIDPAPTTAPPRLFIYFFLMTYQSREPPNYQASVAFDRSFDLLMQEQAWEREARAMLAHVAADYVESVNLDSFAQVFFRHTSFSVSRLRMMDVVSVELSSHIYVRTDYWATIGLLNNSDDDDDYDDDDDEDDDDYDDDDDEGDEDDEDEYYFDSVFDDEDDYFDRGSRPAASAAAVEGLKMVAAEEPDSCSICLEDFVMGAPVLFAMPCSHLFHATCLKKWLEQSCSCPLCRFSLPTS